MRGEEVWGAPGSQRRKSSLPLPYHKLRTVAASESAHKEHITRVPGILCQGSTKTAVQGLTVPCGLPWHVQKNPFLFLSPTEASCGPGLTGSGVGMLALASPICAHTMEPPLTTISGFAPK